jgi:hypothetical protein
MCRAAQRTCSTLQWAISGESTRQLLVWNSFLLPGVCSLSPAGLHTSSPWRVTCMLLV